MSVKIRLTKTGKKHRISYRLVAQDTKSKRDGRFLEILGYYLPYEKKATKLKIDQKKLNTWLSYGALPTQAVANLIESLKNGRSS